MGSCESGRRWQLKGQLKEKRSRAWLHCRSAEEQTERQGWRTPPWGLHWGRNIPHTSLRKGSKHASSISTWTTKQKRWSVWVWMKKWKNTGNLGKLQSMLLPGTVAGLWQLLSDQQWTARCLGMTWGCSWGLDTSPPRWTHTMKLSACGKENHSYSCFTLRRSNIWLSENLDLQFLIHKVIYEMSCKLFSDGVCFSCFRCDFNIKTLEQNLLYLWV